MSVSRACTLTSSLRPMLMINWANRRASVRPESKEPRLTFTSTTRPLRSSASFFDIAEAAIRASDSTVAVSFRKS